MYKALLIDDEPWALRGLQGSCDWMRHGYDRVDSTGNSQEAICFLRNGLPDLVISDIRMPDLTGIELLKFARSSGLDCEFVFVSGFSEFEYAQDAINNGAFAYLLKPVDPNALEKVLGEIAPRLLEKIQKRAFSERAAEDEVQHAGYLNPNFIDLLTYVKAHFADNLTIPFLSGQYHLNQTYISDLFRKTIGKSFSQYLTELRIECACALLKTSHLPIQEVARQAGYRDYCNFVRAFKMTLNTTPAKYRNGD